MDTVDRYNQDLEFLEKTFKPNLNKEAQATGYCLYCGEPLHEKGKRWCDFECMKAWEKERQRKGK